MKIGWLVLTILFIISLSSALAQKQKKNFNYQLNIKKAKSAVVIDGILNEPDWKAADVAKDFYMVLPMDTSSRK